MKSLIKELLMKRRAKLNEEPSVGLLGEEDPTDEEIVGEPEEGVGDKEPLTIKIEVEGKPEEEKDLAPGAPSNPEYGDDGNTEDMHGKLIDAIMGGYSEDEIKSRHGGGTLKGKMRQAALKMKK